MTPHQVASMYVTGAGAIASRGGAAAANAQNPPDLTSGYWAMYPGAQGHYDALIASGQHQVSVPANGSLRGAGQTVRVEGQNVPVLLKKEVPVGAVAVFDGTYWWARWTYGALISLGFLGPASQIVQNSNINPVAGVNTQHGPLKRAGTGQNYDLMACPEGTTSVPRSTPFWQDGAPITANTCVPVMSSGDTGGAPAARSGSIKSTTAPAGARVGHGQSPTTAPSQGTALPLLLFTGGALALLVGIAYVKEQMK